MKASLALRFWAKVARMGSADCWPWTACRNQGAYGRIGLNGKLMYAHRVSWELHNGPIPDGLLVCHHCDNPPCVNPLHLFLGTDADNVADCKAKGRHRSPAGGNNHNNAKLLPREVRLIRSSYAKGGITQRALGKLFNVSGPNVNEIVHNHTWTGLEYQPKERRKRA